MSDEASKSPSDSSFKVESYTVGNDIGSQSSLESQSQKQIPEELEEALKLSYVVIPDESYHVTPSVESTQNMNEKEFEHSYNYFVSEILKNMPLHAKYYMRKSTTSKESSKKLASFMYVSGSYDMRLLGFLIRCMYSMTEKYNVNYFYVCVQEGGVKVIFDSITEDGKKLDHQKVCMELYKLGQETLKPEVQEIMNNLELVKTKTIFEINTNLAYRNFSCYKNKVYDIFKVSERLSVNNYVTNFYCLKLKDEKKKNFFELKDIKDNTKKQTANVGHTLLLIPAVRKRAETKFCNNKVKFIEYDEKSLGIFEGRPTIQVAYPKQNQELINSVNMFLNIATVNYSKRKWNDIRPETGEFTPVPTDLVPVELDDEGWKYNIDDAIAKILDVVETEIIIRIIETFDEEIIQVALNKRLKVVMKILKRILNDEENDDEWMCFTHITNVKNFITGMFNFITMKDYSEKNCNKAVKGFLSTYKKREPKNFYTFKEHMNDDKYMEIYKTIYEKGVIKHKGKKYNSAPWQSIE